MASGSALIRIEGFSDVRQAVKRLETVEQRREWRKASLEVSTFVVREARSEASTRLQRKAANSGLSATTVNTGGAVRLSARLFPGTFGAEFGAWRNQRRKVRRNSKQVTVKGWNQFPTWRGQGSNTGYFLWPAIRTNDRKIVEMFADAVETVFKQE